jgi:hypothetical protein
VAVNLKLAHAVRDRGVQSFTPMLRNLLTSFFDGPKLKLMEKENLTSGGIAKNEFTEAGFTWTVLAGFRLSPFGWRRTPADRLRPRDEMYFRPSSLFVASYQSCASMSFARAASVKRIGHTTGNAFRVLP